MAFLLKNLLQYRNNIAINVLDDDDNYEKVTSRQEALKPEFFRQLLDEAINKKSKKNQVMPTERTDPDSQRLDKLSYYLKDQNLFSGQSTNETPGSLSQRYLDQKLRLNQRQILTNQMKMNDTIAAIIGSFGVVTTFILNDVYIDNGRATSNVVGLLQIAVSISTLILAGFIFRHYSIYHEMTKSDAVYPKKYFWQTKSLRWFLFEIMLNLIHAPPYVDAEVTLAAPDRSVLYSLIDLISILMVVRIYLILRLFGLYSKWTEGAAAYACEVNECENDILFALKASFTDNPYWYLSISMVVGTIIIGLCLRVVERPYYNTFQTEDDRIYKPPKLQDFDTVWNVFWLVFVTMSTVGFGDYYPVTHVGRGLISLAALYGIFNTSLVVYTLAVSVGLDNSETKAYQMLRRQKQKVDLMNKATHVITNFIRFSILNRHPLLDRDKNLQNKLNKIDRALQLALIHFRVAREARKHASSSVNHQLKELIENLKVDIKAIKTDMIILEEINEKLNSIEDYNLRVMGKLNQEYSILLYTEKMLDLLNNNEQIPTKTVSTLRSLASMEPKDSDEIKEVDEDENNYDNELDPLDGVLDKTDQQNAYNESNLIKNIRKVNLQIKTDTADSNEDKNELPEVAFEPSTPL